MNLSKDSTGDSINSDTRPRPQDFGHTLRKCVAEPAVRPQGSLQENASKGQSESSRVAIVTFQMMRVTASLEIG